MKKFFLGVPLFLLVFGLFTLNVHAIGNPVDKLKEVREERLEKKQEFKENRQEKREDLRDKAATKQAELRQKAAVRLKEMFLKILKRHTAALERLDKIAQRIASRALKLKERGVDTTGAVAALDAAKVKGQEATSALADAQSKVDAIDSSTLNVKDELTSAKGAIEASKKALIEYHKALVAAARELKAGANTLKETDEGQ